MRLFIFFACIPFLIGGCAMFGMAPIIPPDLGNDPAPTSGPSREILVRIAGITSQSPPILEWGTSEVYLAIGAKNSSLTDSTFRVVPPQGGIELRSGEREEVEASLYRGRLFEGEAVAVNVSLNEQDCNQTERGKLAQSLVPQTVRFREPESEALAAGVEAQSITTIPWLLRGAQLALGRVFDLAREYCFLDSDDVLGTLTIFIQNDGGRISVSPECGANCRIMGQNGGAFGIVFQNQGEHQLDFYVLDRE